MEGEEEGRGGEGELERKERDPRPAFKSKIGRVVYHQAYFHK